MSTANLTFMRRSFIWFVLALAWGLDCVLAFAHHNRLQAALTAFFAACFFVAGLLFRKQEGKSTRPNRQSGTRG